MTLLWLAAHSSAGVEYPSDVDSEWPEDGNADHVSEGPEEDPAPQEVIADDVSEENILRPNVEDNIKRMEDWLVLFEATMRQLQAAADVIRRHYYAALYPRGIPQTPTSSRFDPFPATRERASSAGRGSAGSAGGGAAAGNGLHCSLAASQGAGRGARHRSRSRGSH